LPQKAARRRHFRCDGGDYPFLSASRTRNQLVPCDIAYDSVDAPSENRFRLEPFPEGGLNDERQLISRVASGKVAAGIGFRKSGRCSQSNGVVASFSFCACVEHHAASTVDDSANFSDRRVAGGEVFKCLQDRQRTANCPRVPQPALRAARVLGKIRPASRHDLLVCGDDEFALCKCRRNQRVGQPHPPETLDDDVDRVIQYHAPIARSLINIPVLCNIAHHDVADLKPFRVLFQYLVDTATDDTAS
jgi:hypothetical protein